MGKLRAINSGNGILGVVPGTNTQEAIPRRWRSMRKKEKTILYQRRDVSAARSGTFESGWKTANGRHRQRHRLGRAIGMDPPASQKRTHPIPGNSTMSKSGCWIISAKDPRRRSRSFSGGIFIFSLAAREARQAPCAIRPSIGLQALIGSTSARRPTAAATARLEWTARIDVPCCRHWLNIQRHMVAWSQDGKS